MSVVELNVHGISDLVFLSGISDLIFLSLLLHKFNDILVHLLDLHGLLIVLKLREVLEWLSSLAWGKLLILISKLNQVTLSKLVLSSFLEELVPGFIFGHSLSGSSSHVWFWHLEVEVILVTVVVELDVGGISHLNSLELTVVKEVISILLMVILDILWVSSMVVVLLVSLSSSHAFLGVVSFEVLVEESIIVALWGKLGIGKFLVVVSNSWEILWSINNFWVISSLKILILSTMESLRWVIEIEPVGTSLGLLIERRFDSSSLLSKVRSSTGLVFMVLKNFSS